MDKIAQQLKAYIDTHPFDPGDSDCETVLDQLYQAYAESHENDPREIRDGFKELDKFLEVPHPTVPTAGPLRALPLTPRLKGMIL